MAVGLHEVVMPETGERKSIQHCDSEDARCLTDNSGFLVKAPKGCSPEDYQRFIERHPGILFVGLADEGGSAMFLDQAYRKTAFVYNYQFGIRTIIYSDRPMAAPGADQLNYMQELRANNPTYVLKKEKAGLFACLHQ